MNETKRLLGQVTMYGGKGVFTMPLLPLGDGEGLGQMTLLVLTRKFQTG